MATVLDFDNGYRLRWRGIAIEVQRKVTRKKKDGTTYEDWEDLGYYSHTQLAQATKHIVRHYASTHGEVAPQELVERLDAFVEAVEEVLARVDRAA